MGYSQHAGMVIVCDGTRGRGEAHRARAVERSRRPASCATPTRATKMAIACARGTGSQPADAGVMRLGKKTIGRPASCARIARCGARRRSTLDPAARAAVAAGAATVRSIVAAGKRRVYGINTGFGKLAQTRIPADELAQLQLNIVLSHAAGTGRAARRRHVVRLVLALKVASLAARLLRRASGVIETLLALYNAGIYPCIPAKGSVGASGDLAPLAHLSLALIGAGRRASSGARCPRAERAGTQPARAARARAQGGPGAAERHAGLDRARARRACSPPRTCSPRRSSAGALSVDAARRQRHAFRRAHPRRCAASPARSRSRRAYRELLAGSEIRRSHLENDDRGCRTPISLRCQPQVMGACLDQMRYAARMLEREAERRHRQPARVRRDGEIALRRQLPRRAGGASPPTRSRSRSPRSARSRSGASRS